ncbi:hypothetical protein [Catenulispora subtropica]|uniref:Uncharacterized protein n=1 Tax=Catenulispora subtropica TaxID=450798 RepID=A0ABN2SKB7_9ACTN
MGYLGGTTVDAAAAKTRAPLPAVPPGAAVRVRDVLLNCGRVLDREEAATFGLYRRALRLLEETASRFPPLADILMIAASQTHGGTDLLSGRPWPDPEHKFVTMLFKGKVLRCQRTAECHLGTGCPACPFPAASGVTLEGPAAVYAADASARRVDDEVAAVRLAATLMHEYTHVALRRMYGNVSLPWFEREGVPAAEVDPRIVRLRERRNERVSALMQAFDGMKPVRIPDAEPNAEVRGYLVDIATDWCAYGAGTKVRYQESVPYIVEAYFHACRLGRQDAVATLFGLFVSSDPFLLYVVPEFADMAAVVRGTGLISDR